MKKAMIAATLCFLFAAGCLPFACAKSDSGPGTEPPLPTAAPALSPNADFLTVVRTLLPDAQIIFTEDGAALAENGAARFENDLQTSLNEEAAACAFKAKKNEAYAKMSPNVGTFAGARPDTDQAVLIRFMPVDCDNLKISAETDCEHWIEFDSAGYPGYSAYLWEHTVLCLSEFPQTFQMQQEKWYYCLMAVDLYGNFRFLMWEDGRADTQGYFAKRFNGDGDILRRITEGDRLTWRFTFRLTKKSTLLVSQYWILDFTEMAR